MSEILEHDTEDLKKGLLRLGREFKSTPLDLTGRFNDIELIPVWKVTGTKPDAVSETHAWLLDHNCLTKYGLDVWPKAKDNWYVCVDGRSLGILIKEDNNYKLSCNCFAAFYTQRSGNKDDVLKYCLHIHSQGHEYR